MKFRLHWPLASRVLVQCDFKSDFILTSGMKTKCNDSSFDLLAGKLQHGKIAQAQVALQFRQLIGSAKTPQYFTVSGRHHSNPNDFLKCNFVEGSLRI